LQKALSWHLFGGQLDAVVEASNLAVDDERMTRPGAEVGDRAAGAVPRDAVLVQIDADRAGWRTAAGAVAGQHKAVAGRGDAFRQDVIAECEAGRVAAGLGCVVVLSFAMAFVIGRRLKGSLCARPPDEAPRHLLRAVPPRRFAPRFPFRVRDAPYLCDQIFPAHSEEAM